MNEILQGLDEQQLIYLSKTVLLFIEYQHLEIDYICSINAQEHDKELSQRLAQYLNTLDRLSACQFFTKIATELEAAVSSRTTTLITELQEVNL
ncbi:MAG TPA: hypothetical protein VK203_07800 [Nostocaceae cyanobacterium]|nr:hypothetical protein [Nostocaceae cyanobacterium]